MPSHASQRTLSVENISLHSVYDTTKCTRDGDTLTAGGAVGGVPFEPCRRRSRAPALSHASPPWQSPVSNTHALSYRDRGVVPGKRPVAWATAHDLLAGSTQKASRRRRGRPGAGRQPGLPGRPTALPQPAQRLCWVAPHQPHRMYKKRGQGAHLFAHLCTDTEKTSSRPPCNRSTS
jgi:hypothetical protein